MQPGGGGPGQTTSGEMRSTRKRKSTWSSRKRSNLATNRARRSATQAVPRWRIHGLIYTVLAFICSWLQVTKLSNTQPFKEPYHLSHDQDSSGFLLGNDLPSIDASVGAVLSGAPGSSSGGADASAGASPMESFSSSASFKLQV